VFNEANKQIQAIPTPTIYVSSGGGRLFDTLAPMLELSAFTAIQGQLADGGDDNVVNSFALSVMVVNGPQPFSDDDSYSSALQLSSFTAVTADGPASQSDAYTVNLALSAFSAVTAQTGSTKTDTAAVAYNLSAFIV